MLVTRHAEKRIRKRAGIPKDGTENAARRALEKGLKHSDVTGRLKKYFDKLYFSYGVANNVRVHGQKVYLFRNETLITVFTLPRDLYDLADKAAKKKRALEMEKAFKDYINTQQQKRVDSTCTATSYGEESSTMNGKSSSPTSPLASQGS